MMAGRRLAEIINSAWAEIFLNIAGQARDADDQLLRAHWLATQDPNRREWKQIASVKAAFERSKYISGDPYRLKAAKDRGRRLGPVYVDLKAYVTDLRKSLFLKEVV